MGAAALVVCGNVSAADRAEAGLEELKRQVSAERQALELQLRAVQDQALRLQAIEDRLLDMMRGKGASPQGPAQEASRVERVGEAPSEEAKPAPQVAALAEQGGVITHRGRLTLE